MLFTQLFESDFNTNEARVGNRMSDIEIGSPKIVYYKGKAVGEVGIDHEASPGNGQYYIKHYLTGKDMVGFDTKQEALGELKYIVQQMDESVNPQDYDSDEDYNDAVEADDLDLDKFGNGWDIPDEIAVLTNQLRYAKSQYERDYLKDRIKRYEDIYYGEDELNEFAPGGDNNGDRDPEDVLFRFAKLWYSAPDVATQQRVEQALAKIGWEIGELESEEGGAFVMRIGDDAGDSYIGWSEEDLAGLDEGPAEVMNLASFAKGGGILGGQSPADIVDARGVVEGVEEAKASTAAFRASNAKRAELNAMTPEERKEYDKKRAEQHRKRDDARLEKERQKLSAKKGVSEADKKKDDAEPQIKDVALQRAISRAKADFPTAGSGIEALSKDFMRSQEQDQKSFDQIRQAERRQNQMLSKINQIDQEQEQEIKDLEQQNSGLAQRLQQLQSVNSNLEKKLAAMSGRKSDKKSSVAGIPSSVSAPNVPTRTVEPTAPKSITKPAPKSKPVVKQLAAPTPGARAFGSMTPALSAAGNPQQSLFKSDYAQDSANLALQKVKQDAQDIGFRDVASNDKLRKLAQRELETTDENKESKPERPEADYGDEYQSMVKRVGQMAAQGPRKTVWDPVKRVYKTVPVNK
jgi:predicted  nucleic acid-binding Zn-ribbon protein